VPHTFQVQLGVFASPDYAHRLRSRRRKKVWSPCDLGWITWSYPNEHVLPRPLLEELIPDFRPVFASNDYLTQQRAVAFGLGVMVLPRAYYPKQSTGRLVEIPVDLPLPTGELYVVCAKTMRWVPRVQAVLERLRHLLFSVEGM